MLDAPLLPTFPLLHRCLADYQPRMFDAECCNILCNFAEIVVRDAERYALEGGVPFVDIGSALSSGEDMSSRDDSGAG